MSTDAHRKLAALDLDALGPIGDHVLACMDRGLRPRTLLLKVERLTEMERIIGKPLHTATLADCKAWWRTLQRRGVKNNTRATYRIHAMGYFRWLVQEEVRDDNPIERIEKPVTTRGVPRDIDAGPVLHMLAGLDERQAGAAGPGRQWFMVALMLWGGLRCAEVAQVDPRRDLVNRADGTYLHVNGKGGHRRAVRLLSSDLVEALRNAPAGWLLPHRSTPGDHVTDGAVSCAVGHLLKSHGIKASAHQLRHTYGTALYIACRDVIAVQHQLGHASLNTTQIYVRGAGLDPSVMDRLYSNVSPLPPRPDDPAPRNDAGDEDDGVAGALVPATPSPGPLPPAAAVAS